MQQHPIFMCAWAEKYKSAHAHVGVHEVKYTLSPTSPGLYSKYSSLNTSSPVTDSSHFASTKPWQIPSACTLKCKFSLKKQIRFVAEGGGTFKVQRKNCTLMISQSINLVAVSNNTNLLLALSLVISQSMISLLVSTTLTYQRPCLL